MNDGLQNFSTISSYLILLSNLVCQEGSNAFDSCGQRCTCVAGRLVDCIRIRKEFTSMTFTERQRHINAIKTVSTDPRFKADYDKLINDHRKLFHSGIHDGTHFLPWHRYFILRYEKILRRVNCKFTVAYWDWSLVSRNPFNTANREDLWHSANTGFGGDGVGEFPHCVQTGPFRHSQWSLVPPPAETQPQLARRCLSRGFNGNPPDSLAVEMVLQTPVGNFSDFELMLRYLHGVVHCLIDDTMCSKDSASAPEFFLHHGFIDKMWDDWQKKSDAHKNAFFPSVNGSIPDTQLRPVDVIDVSSQPGGVRVEYQSPEGAATELSFLRGRCNLIYGSG